MTTYLDLEIKKAFTDLQKKMVETKQKLKIIDIEIGNLMAELQIIIMARREITALPTETKTYHMVRRMFLQTEMRDVLIGFNLRDVKVIERIEELRNNKDYLQRNMHESRNNLREMVKQRKELPEE